MIRVLIEAMLEFPLEGQAMYVVAVSYAGLVDGIIQVCQVPSASGFRVSWFRVSGFGFPVSRFRVSGFEFRLQSLGFRV